MLEEAQRWEIDGWSCEFFRSVAWRWSGYQATAQWAMWKWKFIFLHPSAKEKNSNWCSIRRSCANPWSWKRGSWCEQGRFCEVQNFVTFHKRKDSPISHGTIFMIPGELEHLESLVKLARRKRDSETTKNQVSVVSALPSLRKICVNKTHRSKTLHLPVEISNCIVEGLVDTGASMSVLAAAVVRELGIMHLVTGNENYKTASGVITRALGRVDEIQVRIGGIQCAMTFMVVDTDGYDVLLGLDFLMKIGTVVDVERGLIQVRHGPGTNVEVLPLTMVNLL